MQDAQEAMTKACANDPNSSECKTAQENYSNQVKTLEEYAKNEKQAIKDAEKDLKDAAREDNKADRQSDRADKKADKAEQKDKDRAEKAVENAQKDVDKYCTLGHVSYNAEKCEKAKNDLTAAENDDTYKKMHGDSETAAKEKDARAEQAKQEELDALKNGDAANAMESYISDGDLKAMESNVADAKSAAKNAQDEADTLKAARDAVCADNPKGKKCREAAEAYDTAQTSADAAANKASALEDDYNHSKNVASEAKTNL